MKLKKWLLALATFAVMTVVCAVCAGAETYQDFEYSALDDGRVKITGYNGGAETVVIPDTIDGKSVTSIGRRAFEGCTKLTKASISPKLKVMTSMYSKCINLKEMPEIPETVYAMDNAFAGDISLTKLSTIPVGVTTIDSCFSDCKKIEGNITINATPSSYNSCFNNAAVATKVNIVGQCKNAVLIATTATNNPL